MIYVLLYDSDDREFDINGKGQQFLDELKKELYKNSNNNIHFDYDENNNHDISFARIPLNYSEIITEPNDNGLDPIEMISTYLSRIGFNNPKKLYLAVLDQSIICDKKTCEINNPNLKTGKNILIRSRYVSKNNQEYLISNKDQIKMIINAVDLSKIRNFKFPINQEMTEHCIIMGKLDGKKINLRGM